MMRKQIILATRNQGKLHELEALLSDFHLQILTPDEFPALKEVEETGCTFEENALLKARYACKVTGLPALADDSGLEVDALNGEPGVYSARFYLKHPLQAEAARAPLNPASSNKDAANIACLLERMESIPQNRRQARFCCTIAAVAPGGAFITAQGFWSGVITRAPAGNNGFGYDPVFLDEQLNLTVAQMAQDIKNTRSHRYLALQNLVRLWPAFWAKISG
ncbi:MAG: RdgB/HAM1 family non-canonical purine NTP pyrophosphatase [Deltaproteobacteria bacterium]|jgi:XTP/dITP diphosphohydrolase|nr:RdgB/HAM1 family non-canonical purine NTP pyrophosphatase [Deltaproteobacteria bacterium]